MDAKRGMFASGEFLRKDLRQVNWREIAITLIDAVVNLPKNPSPLATANS